MLPSMVRLGAAMGRISMATRDELVAALSGRYGASTRKERGRILDEFTAVCSATISMGRERQSGWSL